MPTLRINSVKLSNKSSIRARRPIDDKIDIRSKVYNSPEWHSIRKSYMMEHPFDEVALIDKKYIPANLVHHKNAFANYTRENVLTVAYDTSNLCSLSNKTHNLFHGIMESMKLQVNGQSPQEIYDIIVNYCKKHNKALPW